MTSPITVQDVKDFYPNSLPDSVILRYINMFAQADQCMDDNGIDTFSQEIVKLTAIAHMLSIQQGGTVVSETDMDGASVRFKESKGSTQYIDQLRSLPGYSCISRFIDKPRRFAVAVGC